MQQSQTYYYNKMLPGGKEQETDLLFNELQKEPGVQSPQRIGRVTDYKGGARIRLL